MNTQLYMFSGHISLSSLRLAALLQMHCKSESTITHLKYSFSNHLIIRSTHAPVMQPEKINNYVWPS